ncbi:MAG TPA: hypothetical protein VNX25_03370 [Verrucomicrobiae bacterium]|nr:hypothetical protein [Verrucomicrobiae bacterium]
MIKMRPIARCTDCGKSTPLPHRMEKTCATVVLGKTCLGVYRSMPRAEDWKLCPSCQGAGKEKRTACGTCEGDGWLSRLSYH